MGIGYGPRAIKGRSDGLSSATPAISAAAIKLLDPTATDGVYWINLPTVGATQIYCLMDKKWDGGGWMMMLKATTGTTFNYDANYWTTTNTLNPTDYTRNDADAKFNTMNYFAARDIMAVWPDISTTGGSISGTGTWTWMERNFAGDGVRVAPVTFFANPSSYAGYASGFGGSGNFKRDAKTFSGWQSGVFSSQVDIRFYGFNYTPYGGGTNGRARWGFGWNENGEGLFPSVSGAANGSNDVAGGIGLRMEYNGSYNYSAGDRIGCCQDTTGINRSARVEVYVR